jgi:hypothetical protein
MIRLVVAATLLLALAPAGSAAALGALPYNLVLSPRPTAGPTPSAGTVTGQFGGVPVQGTYSGRATAGTITLMVRGVVFVDGAYVCSSSGCALSGAVAGIRVSEMRESTLGGIGQATAAAFGNREAWVAAVSAWAHSHLGDAAASVIGAASAVTMPPSGDTGAAPGSAPRNEAGGGTGGSGGGTGGGMGGGGY